MYCRLCGKKVKEYCHNYLCLECCSEQTAKEIAYYTDLHNEKDEENTEPELCAIRKIGEK